MKSYYLLMSSFLMLLFATDSCSSLAGAVTAMDANKLGDLSEEKVGKCFAGFQSAFILVEAKTGKRFCYNPERCRLRLSPCSTYKIFNALVGVDTGILKDENYSMKWDGTQYPIENWNRDQTLQSAVTNSCVWYFQRLATLLGEKRMQKYIHAARYGNENISGGITKFWLGDTLAISADEQVNFLGRLITDKLPFARRSMAIVRGLIRLEQNAKGTLYGKTGSDMKDGKGILGWFVGYLVQPDSTYIFATNMQADDGASGLKARELTLKLLKEADLF